MRKDVCVIAKMDEFGLVTPLTLIWEDGRKFNIDKVLDIRKKASTKGGGMGLRYTCSILGKEKFMWLDGYFWFVEVEAKND